MTNVIDFQRQRAVRLLEQCKPTIRAMVRERLDQQDDDASIPRRACAKVRAALEMGTRAERREAWQSAKARTRYWRAKIDYADACQVAAVQGLDLPDLEKSMDDYAAVRQSYVDLWRVALVDQLLTPVPYAHWLAWKRRIFKTGEHKRINFGDELIQIAIDADEAWLRANRKVPISDRAS